MNKMEIAIIALTVLNGITLGLYLAKRKQYGELVESNRFDEERRWTLEENERIWRHISEMEKNCCPTNKRGGKSSL